MHDSTAYDFVVIRLLPHAHLYESRGVGVVLHARTADFLDAKFETHVDRLAALAPGADSERIARYLANLGGVARGESASGRLALLPPSERFHWLAAPRSDLIQSSPIHGGLTSDPAATLLELFDFYVGSEVSSSEE